MRRIATFRLTVRRPVVFVASSDDKPVDASLGSSSLVGSAVLGDPPPRLATLLPGRGYGGLTRPREPKANAGFRAGGLPARSGLRPLLGLRLEERSEPLDASRCACSWCRWRSIAPSRGLGVRTVRFFRRAFGEPRFTDRPRPAAWRGFCLRGCPWLSPGKSSLTITTSARGAGVAGGSSRSEPDRVSGAPLLLVSLSMSTWAVTVPREGGGTSVP